MHLRPAAARLGATVGTALFCLAVLAPSPLEAGDKWKHFGASAVFGAAGETVLHITTDMSRTRTIFWGTALGTVPGIAKEILDSRDKDNSFSGSDLAADLAGALVGAVLANLVNSALHVGVEREGNRSGLTITFSCSF